MQLVEFEGQTVEFPDDFTDDEIAEALSTLEPAAPIGGAAGDPMIEAELFDGTILEFPHGTAPEVIQRVAKEQTALRRGSTRAPALAALKDPDSSFLDTIMGGVGAVGGVLDQGARGFAEGVTNIAGLPGTFGQGINSLLRAGAEKAGAPQAVQDIAGNVNLMAHIWPTGERIQQAGDNVNDMIADAIGTTRPDQTPDNFPERFVNRTGEEVGAMVIPSLGVLGKADRLRRTFGEAAPAAARESGRLSRMFVEPAVVNPSRYLGNETKAAVGAGVGAAGMNEAVDPNTREGQVADIIGAVTGAGGAAAGGKLLQGGSEMLRAIFGGKGYVDDVVRDAATDRITEAARIPTKPGEAADTTGLVETIMSGPRVSDTIPGVRESLADRTRNPGIASLEYNRQSGPSAGEFNARRQTNARAIDETLSALDPGGSPAALRGELEVERTRRLGDAGVMRQNAEDELSGTTQRLQPSTPYAEDRGAAVRGGVANAERAARVNERTAWEGIGGDVDPAPLAERFGRVGDDMPVARRQVVADLENALGIPANFEGSVDVQEIAALRSRLTTAQRNANSGPQPDANRANAIGTYIDELDNFMAGSELPAETQRRTTDARAVSRDVNERFNRPNDPLAAVLSTREGRPDVPDSGVARRFLQPDSGQASNLDRLLAETDLSSGGRATRQGLRDEILADIDKRGLVGKPDELDSYLNERSSMFDRFPDLRDELAGAGATSRSLAEARAAETTMQRDLGTSERRGTGTVGKFLSFSDANSDKAISEVLAARDPAAAADELLTFVGDAPEAVSGARKALWDNMTKASRRAGETTQDVSGSQQWMPAALKRWLDDPRNREVAGRFYRDNPEHIENVRKIADALQGLDVRNTAKVPNTSGTAQSVLPTAETAGSLALAYKRGQIGPAFIATRLGAVFARRSVRNARSGAIERMLDDALLNPDAAALLLRENNPANRAALQRRAKNWFGNETATIMNMLSADDEDETERAIKRPL